jgi:hypothetical protein
LADFFYYFKSRGLTAAKTPTNQDGISPDQARLS